mmetsp:Transcript_20807/g.23872  ORF Transcript_20807/g.23872 Transcript_20807/m.23872 type:complete len:120 (+) Transcript_20807:92-451(+)
MMELKRKIRMHINKDNTMIIIIIMVKNILVGDIGYSACCCLEEVQQVRTYTTKNEWKKMVEADSVPIPFRMRSCRKVLEKVDTYMHINIYLLKENMYSHTHMYLNTHIDGPLHKNDMMI